MIETFSKYCESQGHPKTTVKIFEKLLKEIETENKNIKMPNIKLQKIIIKNFSIINELTVDFEKEKSIYFFAPPRSGKTLKTEIIIYALFGKNKTNQYYSISEDPTEVTLLITVGKEKYKIYRTHNNKSNTNSCAIYKQNEEEPFIEGAKECNLYLEDLLKIKYEQFHEIFYCGELSIPLHYKKPMDIKNMFIYLLNESSWSEINTLAYTKLKTIADDIKKYENSIDLLYQISDKMTEDELKTAILNESRILKDIKSKLELEVEIPNYGNQLEQINTKIKKIEKSINEIGSANTIEQEIKTHEKYTQTIKDNLSILKEYWNLFEKHEAAKIKAGEIEREGKLIRQDIEKIADSICPFSKQKCSIIEEGMLAELKEKRNQLLKEHKEAVMKYGEIEEKINQTQYKLSAIDWGTSSQDILYNKPEFILDKVQNSLKELKEQLKTIEPLTKEVEKLYSKRKTIIEDMEKFAKTAEKREKLKEQKIVIETSIANMTKKQQEYKTAMTGMEKAKKLKKEEEHLAAIYEATKRDGIPKIEAGRFSKTISNQIKSFCKDLLPFTKYQFDDNMQILIDDKPLVLCNSASKRIVDIAFRLALAKQLCTKLPVFIIDDVGLYLSENLMTGVIDALDNVNAHNIICTTNRR